MHERTMKHEQYAEMNVSTGGFHTEMNQNKNSVDNTQITPVAFINQILSNSMINNAHHYL